MKTTKTRPAGGASARTGPRQRPAAPPAAGPTPADTAAADWTGRHPAAASHLIIAQAADVRTAVGVWYVGARGVVRWLLDQARRLRAEAGESGSPLLPLVDWYRLGQLVTHLERVDLELDGLMAPPEAAWPPDPLPVIERVRRHWE